MPETTPLIKAALNLRGGAGFDVYYFAIKYGRIKKRRGHKKAIIAIARMMMVCIYHMVSEKKPFTPTDYEELMNPQNHVERVVLNENNVFAYLESLGYDSSKLVKRNDN